MQTQRGPFTRLVHLVTLCIVMAMVSLMLLAPASARTPRDGGASPGGSFTVSCYRTPQPDLPPCWRP